MNNTDRKTWPWWTKTKVHLESLHKSPTWLAQRLGYPPDELESCLNTPTDAIRGADLRKCEAHLIIGIARIFGWAPSYLYDDSASYPYIPSFVDGT